MEQLVSVWKTLGARRRIFVVAATLAMFAAVLMMSRLASRTDMALLYSGLEPAAAGEVVQALEQRTIAYDVRGSAIYVARSERDRLRLSLASEGMPANGGVGYELLDTLTGFGTTSQMFDAAYWRAKEGELARTILTNPQIRGARVHIASAGGQGFRRAVKPSASVSVTTVNGALSPAQATALRHLVASSVSNLSADDVSIIDSTGGLIATSQDGAQSATAANHLSERLRQNVSRLLAARMGPGKSVVEVSVETVSERESVIERHFDPDSRVAISTETEERSTSSKNRGAAGVSVASNLPEGDATTGNQSSNADTQTLQRTNYEVSETQREILRTPGAIKRLSVAVLLEGTRRIDNTGAEIWEPLPDAELQNLRELVQSTVGFNAERGDVITLKSMPFDPVVPAGTAAEASFFDGLGLNLMSLIQIAVLAIVGLVLGLFVVRPILTNPQARNPASIAQEGYEPALIPGLKEPPEPAKPQPATGELLDPEAVVTPQDGSAQGLALPLIAPPEDPVERLRHLIQERRDETVEILRNWMEEEEETA